MTFKCIKKNLNRLKSGKRNINNIQRLKKLRLEINPILIIISSVITNIDLYKIKKISKCLSLK